MQKVSVIIPNYNYGRFLKPSIQSVLDQTMKPHEIIVVDDGSTDNSMEMIRSFGESITAIKQDNAGVAAARNKGAEIATGEFLAFLDADDYWHPEKLAKQMLKFSSDPDVGFVHCGSCYVDENGVPIKDYVVGGEGWIANELLKFQPVVIANTLIVKRSLFSEIGGFDMNRDLHPSEDWDLCYRLSRICKLGFVHEALLYYRQHGSGGHTNIARMERAMTIAFEKAFQDPARQIQKVRRMSYGNLYLVLAGSYYHVGQNGRAIICMLKALVQNPLSVFRLFGISYQALKRVFAK